MKGVIAGCLSEMIEAKFGAAKRQEILAAAGMPNRTFLATADVPDAEVMRLLGATCRVLNLSEEKAAEAFGEYWCVTYAPRIYKTYFANTRGAKELLLKMKTIHEQVTKNIPNANPPVFNLTESAPNKVIMTYSSGRNLQSVWLGLVKGVGIAYKERLDVKRLSRDRIEIAFL